MKEIWKDIKGYEGIYQVSNLGRVKRLPYYRKICNNPIKKYEPEHLLKCSDRGDGYLRVNLWKDGVGKQFKVHRLVAEAFIPNIENKRTVNHIDGNPSNNRVDNLEWATDGENIKHSYDKLNRKKAWLGKKGSEHIRSKKVYQYDLDGNLIAEYGSIRQATLNTGISGISLVCNGKQRKAGGYYWSYNKLKKEEVVEYINRPIKSAKRVYMFSKDGKLLASFLSLREAEEETGISRKIISRVCLGKGKTAGGYCWSYNPIIQTDKKK